MGIRCYRSPHTAYLDRSAVPSDFCSHFLSDPWGVLSVLSVFQLSFCFWYLISISSENMLVSSKEFILSSSLYMLKLRYGYLSVARCSRLEKGSGGLGGRFLLFLTTSCSCVCLCVRKCVCVHTCASEPACVQAYSCMCMCKCVCVLVCAGVLVCVWACARVCVWGEHPIDLLLDAHAGAFIPLPSTVCLWPPE